MPYKDPSKQREFQRKWIHKRRVDHFKGKKCARCGKAVSSSTADLDHKTPKRNTDGHKIWSHSKENRSKEIKKTQILCKSCHKKKSKKDKQKMFSESLFEAISNISEEQENPRKAALKYLEAILREETFKPGLPLPESFIDSVFSLDLNETAKSAAQRAAESGIDRKINAGRDKVERPAIQNQEASQRLDKVAEDHSAVLVGSFPNVGEEIVKSYTHNKVPSAVDDQFKVRINKYLGQRHRVGQSDAEKQEHIKYAITKFRKVVDRFRK